MRLRIQKHECIITIWIRMRHFLLQSLKFFLPRIIKHADPQDGFVRKFGLNLPRRGRRHVQTIDIFLTRRQLLHGNRKSRIGIVGTGIEGSGQNGVKVMLKRKAAEFVFQRARPFCRIRRPRINHTNDSYIVRQLILPYLIRVGQVIHFE